MFVCILGTIPGAILIGLAVDYSCSLWKKCDGTEVSCLRYSNSELGTKIFALGKSRKYFKREFVSKCDIFFL